jgi:protein O-GlcNAc transferase
MMSSTSDNAEPRAWANECGARTLGGSHDTLASLGAALRARTDRSSERGVFADLAFASWLELHPASLVDVILLARETVQRGFPRNAGAVPRRELIANAHLSSAMRATLARVLRGDLTPLPEAGILGLLHLWDATFCHSLSPLHLAGLGTRSCDPSASLLVRSMFEPFAAPDDLDLAAIWRGNESLATKLLLAVWALALPAHEVDARSVARVVKNATALCTAMTATPLPPPLAFGMSYVVCAALFRCAYHDIEHQPALAAAGDFVSSMMRRHLPAFATPRPRRPVGDRPRIGYVSTNFRAHPVTRYMGARLFDRSTAHHVTTFVLGTRRDELTARVIAASDRSISLPNALDYAAIARAIVAEDLDLLIFTDVGMDLPTYLLAGLHLAPRQIVMMGHAASSGMPSITHYIGGDHEAESAQRSYRETLIRLPSLGCAQLPPVAPAGTLTRASLGIPDDAVVFVNCSNAIKHVAERDDLLAEILERCPNARLVLKPFFAASEVDPRITDRIVAAARRRGVADRLVIVPPVAGVGEVMDLYALADIQLDTYPFGGWTTNLEALHAGLPLVTREGDFARNRMGAAMLRELGITDGIATTDRELVDAAVRLGTDAALRASLRERILAGRSRFFAPNGSQPAYEMTLAELLH